MHPFGKPPGLKKLGSAMGFGGSRPNPQAQRKEPTGGPISGMVGKIGMDQPKHKVMSMPQGDTGGKRFAHGSMGRTSAPPMSAPEPPMVQPEEGKRKGMFGRLMSARMK